MKFLVLDTGIGVGNALTLSMRGHEVYLYNASKTSFESILDAVNGKGFEDYNLFRLEEETWLDKIEEVDSILAFDVGFLAEIEWLRQHFPEKPVFGGGATEKLEQNRRFAVKLAQMHGLTVPSPFVFDKVEDAIEFVKGRFFGERIVLKLSRFRGSLETFIGTRDFELEKLYSIKELWVFSGYEILLFPFLEGIEVAVTAFFNGREWFDKCFVNFEHVNGGYGWWENSFESLIFRETLMKMTEVLRRMRFRGVIDANCIFDGEKFWLLEFTVRPGYPMSCIYFNMIENLGDVFYAIGSGEKIDIKLNSEAGGYLSVFGGSPDGRERRDWLIFDKVFWETLSSNLVIESIFSDGKDSIVALNLYGRLLVLLEKKHTLNIDSIGDDFSSLLSVIKLPSDVWYDDKAWILDIQDRIRAFLNLSKSI